MYVITGATGNTGSAAAHALLDKKQPVRVIGRSRAKLQPFVAKGADAFIGDLADSESLTRAFTGAKAVYAMIPPDYAGDLRAWQDRAGTAIATAIEQSGVKHVVSLSSVGAHLAEKTGPIAGLHHFEKKLNRIRGLNVLHLRPTYFMENFLPLIPSIKEFGVLGTDFRPDLSLAMIATRDIGVRVAEEMMTRRFKGVGTRELLGPRDLTLPEVAAALGKAVGLPDLSYAQLPYEQVEQALIQMGLPASTAALLSEMDRAINDGVVKPQEKRGRESTTHTTIDEFAKTVFAPAFRGKAAAGN